MNLLTFFRNAVQQIDSSSGQQCQFSPVDLVHGTVATDEPEKTSFNYFRIFQNNMVATINNTSNQSILDRPKSELKWWSLQP